ncbi:hypothetical protein EDB81DRAFT_188520 [Dactylonectria macrodidyma]|uniref:Uncharacterized protein n=1 Tax=Dactylonectria macrodidyma TaxID=307937 RepID=A0A9P9FRJ8_9HYPO|nr:hypothetical protein EDB81DRAFT_188520 [Dactylonectria macrodidyma]
MGLSQRFWPVSSLALLSSFLSSPSVLLPLAHQPYLWIGRSIQRGDPRIHWLQDALNACKMVPPAVCGCVRSLRSRSPEGQDGGQRAACRPKTRASQGFVGPVRQTRGYVVLPYIKYMSLLPYSHLRMSCQAPSRASCRLGRTRKRRGRVGR